VAAVEEARAWSPSRAVEGGGARFDETSEAAAGEEVRAPVN